MSSYNEDSSPVKALEPTQEDSLLKKNFKRRMISIEEKVEHNEKSLGKALERLQAIAELRIVDRVGAKEFNQKIQALNYNKKVHKYANMWLRSLFAFKSSRSSPQRTAAHLLLESLKFLSKSA